MKRRLIIVFISVLSNGADNRCVKGKLDSPYSINIPAHADSPRKRSKSVVERMLGDQLIPELESSPRSKEIFKIWSADPRGPVPGVSATLCKIVRSKSVPQVEVDPPKDLSSLAHEQNIAGTPS